MKKKILLIFITLLLIIATTTVVGFGAETIYKVTDGLYNQAKSGEDLGLSKVPGAEVVQVFTPTSSTDKFCNGIVMTEFQGKLYCQWQSSKQDEDASDTWVAYSVSADDGATWSEPMVLAPSISNGYCSSGGWHVYDANDDGDNDTIVAYINVWPDDVSPRGGYTYYTQSTDGVNWSTMEPVLMKDGSVLNGIFEQDPHILESGRIVSSAHFQPGLFINPVYTDDKSGVKGWVKAKYTNMSGASSTSREMEPSIFVNEDGHVVMIFRDQNSSKKVLASISKDQGESWSATVLTNMPDSRQKQSAGNLPDGTAYIVSCPVNNTTRIPLVITLSSDGKTFDTAYVLRTGSENPGNISYAGKAKRRGYHYPKSTVIGEYLYVSYAYNKEIVEYVRIPLDSISLNSSLELPTESPTPTPVITETPTPTPVITDTPTPTPVITVTPTATTDIKPTDTIIPTESVTPEPDITYMVGDVDMDGDIDSSDALLVLKNAAKLVELNDEQKLASLVNEDESIDAADALMILKYAARLISDFIEVN